jgi:hypothetical protein
VVKQSRIVDPATPDGDGSSERQRAFGGYRRARPGIGKSSQERAHGDGRIVNVGCALGLGGHERLPQQQPAIGGGECRPVEVERHIVLAAPDSVKDPGGLHQARCQCSGAGARGPWTVSLAVSPFPQLLVRFGYGYEQWALESQRDVTGVLELVRDRASELRRA